MAAEATAAVAAASTIGESRVLIIMTGGTYA